MAERGPTDKSQHGSSENKNRQLVVANNDQAAGGMNADGEYPVQESASPRGANTKQLLTVGRVNSHLTEGSSGMEDSPRTASSSDTKRPSSQDSSGSSINLDCQEARAGPTEVVVKGKGVKKITMRFPRVPQPPQGRSYSRLESLLQSEPHFSSTPSGHSLPLSKEESSIRLPVFQTETQSSICSDSLISNRPRSGSSDPTVARAFASHPVGTAEMDERMRQFILHGLEYFQGRNTELQEENRRLLKEVEALVRENSKLMEDIKQEKLRYDHLSSEQDELKCRLDQQESENVRLGEQALEQWQARVKAEEMYIEVKHEADERVGRIKNDLANMKKQADEWKKKFETANAANEGMKTLQAKLEEKSREVHTLSKAATEWKKKFESADRKATADERVELLGQVDCLKEQLRQLQLDREADNRQREAADAHLKALKEQLGRKMEEYEQQQERFMLLKKSFTELMEQNDRLKRRLRDSAGANETWPAASVKTNPELETVRRLEIPSRRRSTNPGQSRRGISDTRLDVDSLPPVRDSNKR